MQRNSFTPVDEGEYYEVGIDSTVGGSLVARHGRTHESTTGIWDASPIRSILIRPYDFRLDKHRLGPPLNVDLRNPFEQVGAPVGEDALKVYVLAGYFP